MRLDSRRYDAFIDSVDDVHDGDTLENVCLRLPGITAKAGTTGQVYPNIFIGAGDKFRVGDVFAQVSVRLSGVDCPELEPRKRLPDGTLRSAAEVAHEKALALKARQVVVDLLTAANLQFQLRNPRDGKYASRIVAELWVAEGDTLVNVGAKLVASSLAYPYAGGTKKRWTVDGPQRLR